MPIDIEHADDPRVAPYRNLRDRQLREAIDRDEGVFVIEGARSLETLLDSPWPLVSVLLTPSRAAALRDMVDAAESRGAPVYVAGSEIFDGIAGYPVHRGVLALAARQPLPDPETVLAGVTTAVVVEGINDHENLGAIFRNAAALGGGAVLLDPTSCDPLYRRSVRVSLGNVLRVPFTRLEPWPGSLGLLTSVGFSVVALDPHAQVTIDAVNIEPPTALLVGSEGSGLTDEARKLATHTARIPMAAGVDSLNVATALAIALHHFAN
ncbi:MAG TPA: RNA methyltransferase [Acidimicrobiales bacterium]|nr:RNA methyltransferase [Acidimicrobiales bacterium]